MSAWCTLWSFPPRSIIACRVFVALHFSTTDVSLLMEQKLFWMPNHLPFQPLHSRDRYLKNERWPKQSGSDPVPVSEVLNVDLFSFFYLYRKSEMCFLTLLFPPPCYLSIWFSTNPSTFTCCENDFSDEAQWEAYGSCPLHQNLG